MSPWLLLWVLIASLALVGLGALAAGRLRRLGRALRGAPDGATAVQAGDASRSVAARSAAAVLDVSDRRVRSLLTPRRELDWIDLEESPAAQKERLLRARHGRLPVGRGSVDLLQGVVRLRDLLPDALQGTAPDLAAHLEEPLVVPESLPLVALLDRFVERGEGFAVVLDEYGGVEGVVTHADAVEALLADLPAPVTGASPAIDRDPEGAYLLDGKLYVEELKALLELSALPREEDRVYRTLGGLVVTLLGRIPAPGESVALEGHRLEVVAMDGPRVGRVRVLPPSPRAGAGARADV